MAAVLFLAACSSATVVSSDRISGDATASASADSNDSDAADDAANMSETLGTDAEGSGPQDSDAQEGDSQGSDTADSDAQDSGTQDSDAQDSGAREGDTQDSGTADENERPQTPQELEEIDGFGIGSAEQLEGLRADCEDGSDQACDILFQISDAGSAEEAFALSCGGRSDTATLFCTEGIDAATEEFFFDPDSSGVSDIVDQCVEFADMTACDFLFFRSPIGSDLEALGGTCGGRVEVAVPDCRTFLRTAE